MLGRGFFLVSLSISNTYVLPLPVKITYLEKLEDPHETASIKTGA